MILLKKKKSDGTYFNFDKILRSGYNIDEQEKENTAKKMANGKRKKIYTSYVDCVMKLWSFFTAPAVSKSSLVATKTLVIGCVSLLSANST